MVFAISRVRRSRLLLALALLLAFGGTLVAGNKKDEGPQSSTSFVVLKDDSGKPIRNAAVVLHSVGKNGKQLKAGFELKTGADGRTHFDGIPYGLLRVQVIAPGFQTFGDDYQINQPEQQITIRLKRPQGQYSIYEEHGSNAAGETATPPQKPDQQ